MGSDTAGAHEGWKAAQMEEFAFLQPCAQPSFACHAVYPSLSPSFTQDWRVYQFLQSFNIRGASPGLSSWKAAALVLSPVSSFSLFSGLVLLCSVCIGRGSSWPGPGHVATPQPSRLTDR